MEQLMQLTDDRLVNLYAEGVDEAFDVLLRRHKDRLYAYIFYATRSSEAADDIFQETFVKAIMTIRQGGYTASDRFYFWLSRIAHNLIIDSFRARQTEYALPADEIYATFFGNGITADDCEARECEAARSRTDIMALIDLLPPDQLEIVRLRLDRRMAFKDIATLKGISINTALSRMRYAVANIRRMVGERRLELLSV